MPIIKIREHEVDTNYEGGNDLYEACFVRIKSELVEGFFMGIFQHSDVIAPSPMVGGHRGGEVAYPVAVIKVNGKFENVKISDVIFPD